VVWFRQEWHSGITGENEKEKRATRDRFGANMNCVCVRVLKRLVCHLASRSRTGGLLSAPRLVCYLHLVPYIKQPSTAFLSWYAMHACAMLTEVNALRRRRAHCWFRVCNTGYARSILVTFGHSSCSYQHACIWLLVVFQSVTETKATSATLKSVGQNYRVGDCNATGS
jgi:hypothetical protein